MHLGKDESKPETVGIPNIYIEGPGGNAEMKPGGFFCGDDNGQIIFNTDGTPNIYIEGPGGSAEMKPGRFVCSDDNGHIIFDTDDFK